jgi:hypothetical protein
MSKFWLKLLELLVTYGPGVVKTIEEVKAAKESK